MFKKAAKYIMAFFLMANLYGCVAILAGAAGGAGTAVWLSGKLSQEVDASRERCAEAVKSAFKYFKYNITKEAIAEDVTQIKGSYTDGRTIWVDIRPLSTIRSKIEIRVGGVDNDKEAARELMDKILRYL